MVIMKSLNKIFTKKTTDYTFSVMFFLIFSIFIFFAIRPSLTTAFALKKEEIDLTKIDKVYEDKIMSIALVQSQMEENRADLPLIKQAISTSPQVNKMVEDIKVAADKSSFEIRKAAIGEVNLFETNNKLLQRLKITVDGVGTFSDFQQFVQIINEQRRLKMIQKVSISRDNVQNVSSDSGQLKIQFDIEGYYL
ncbi:MAG: type 4a pilus biogenesis protein PilO [bacterium]|nr:type 4a pilus biogenesis protein PilO [bacterium]